MEFFSDIYIRHNALVILILLYVPLVLFWHHTQRETSSTDTCCRHDKEPLPLRIGTFSYIRAFICWLFLFNNVFALRPGFYYTGTRDKNAPLLVTSNNFLTVFLLVRRIARRNVRLLVIDTGGINVWCSAAKGRFSAQKIINHASCYDLLNKSGKTDMIIPKLCLSGVRLSDLQSAGINPVIGPVYARGIGEYLDRESFKNMGNDHFHFGLQSRAFTAIPTSLQFLYWFTGIYIVTFWMVSIYIVPVAAVLAAAYPVLFPYLPGKQFAVKGISLGILACIPALSITAYKGIAAQSISFWILFVFATSIFISLSYTGNSPVSNYENVRKETARFLPVVVVLYLLMIPVKLL